LKVTLTKLAFFRYIAPTLACDVPLDTPLMMEEIFGPILPIIKVIDWNLGNRCLYLKVN
jgi:acyl-CoA reductase-like NAD-dependent aldehyde dehydrogenase